MSTEQLTNEQLTKALYTAWRLSQGMCGPQDQREAAAVMLRLHALVTTYEADKIQGTPTAPTPTPVPTAALVEGEPLERAFQQSCLYMFTGHNDVERYMASLREFARIIQREFCKHNNIKLEGGQG